jgi:hypothetical protein
LIRPEAYNAWHCAVNRKPEDTKTATGEPARFFEINDLRRNKEEIIPRDALPDPGKQRLLPAAFQLIAAHSYRMVIEVLSKDKFRCFSCFLSKNLSSTADQTLAMREFFAVYAKTAIFCPDNISSSNSII